MELNYPSLSKFDVCIVLNIYAYPDMRLSYVEKQLICLIVHELIGVNAHK